MMGIPILPIVWLNNLTDETLTNILITFPGDKNELARVKKLKSEERKAVSVHNTTLSDEERPLYLQYVNPKLKITETEFLFNKLTGTYKGNLLVEIKGRAKDGKLEMDVTENFTI